MAKISANYEVVYIIDPAPVSYTHLKACGKAMPTAYWGISSIVKASMMSPSLMSLNFSMLRPHS